MSATKVIKELEKATGVKVNKKDEQEYLKATAFAVADLPEKQWDALSEGAQRWYDSAAKAITDEKTVPSIEEVLDASNKGTDEKEDTSEAEEAPEEKEKPKAKKSKPKQEKEPPKKKEPKAAKEDKEPKEPKAAKVRGGVAEEIRKAVCEDPSRTQEEVGKILKAAGVEYSDARLAQMFSFTHCVLDTLKSLGKL